MSHILLQSDKIALAIVAVLALLYLCMIVYVLIGFAS